MTYVWAWPVQDGEFCRTTRSCDTQPSVVVRHMTVFFVALQNRIDIAVDVLEVVRMCQFLWTQ